MKLNWGTSIVIAIVSFIGFILFFVVRMGTDDKANHDLVTKDYYRDELRYQNEIDAETKAKTDDVQLVVVKKPEGLFVHFPERLESKKIQGKVFLYRPSDKHLDFDFPIGLSNSHLLIPDKRLVDGRWNIKVSWEYNGNSYLHKESIRY